jgi:hypothetical protein
VEFRRKRRPGKTINQLLNSSSMPERQLGFTSLVDMGLEPDPELLLAPGPSPNYERYLPPSPYSLEEELARDPEYLRRSFVWTLRRIARDYDSLDHDHNPDLANSALQSDCEAVRKLASSFDIPEF